MKKVWIALFIVLVAVCGLGAFALKGMTSAKASDAADKTNDSSVTRGDLVVKVVDTGTIDAVKSVELKSQASGRLKKLFVEEGDRVTVGQLVAIIDPQQTQLLVDQNKAQYVGAQNAYGRSEIELQQRKITARADYEQSQLKLAQIQSQLKAQPTLTKANIDSAKATLSAATEARDRLQSTDNPNARTAAESTKREAEANYKNAQIHYQRQVDLEQKGFAASKDVEDAQLSLDLSKTRLDSANDNYNRIDSQLRLDLAKANDDVRKAQADLRSAEANQTLDVNKQRDYVMAKADVEKARMALMDTQAMAKTAAQNKASVDQMQGLYNDAKRQLGETEIRSPIDGVVTKKELNEGELVASISGFSSGTPIIRIEDRTALRVVLNINEIDVAKLTDGMKASVEVDAIPGETFEGTVKRIAPASTNTGATTTAATSTDTVIKYQVEIYLTRADPRLRSGMSAKCTLETLHRSNVLLLPMEFVGKDDKGYFVSLPPAKKGGDPTRQAVTVGESNGTNYEIASGLKDGQQVVKPKFGGPPRKGMMQAGPD